MTGILFDLDGVFYQNGQAIAGAATTLNWVEDHHIPYLFVTNTSSRPRAAIVDKLAGFGIEVDASHILTPPVAANNWLQQHVSQPRVALYIVEDSKVDFTHCQIADSNQQPHAVVVGDLAEGWSFEVMNQAFRQLMEAPDCQLIALGLTRYWRNRDNLQLDVGPFVKALEYATDKQAIVCGKPSASFFEAAAQQLQLPPQQLIMIGDDIKGDIEGAQQAGLRGIQVRTGKFKAADLQHNIRPDAIIDSIADLPDWWSEHIA